jgi:hypothetical protein
MTQCGDSVPSDIIIVLYPYVGSQPRFTNPADMWIWRAVFLHAVNVMRCVERVESDISQNQFWCPILPVASQAHWRGLLFHNFIIVRYCTQEESIRMGFVLQDDSDFDFSIACWVDLCVSNESRWEVTWYSRTVNEVLRATLSARQGGSGCSLTN